jgi:hypothetical protein
MGISDEGATLGIVSHSTSATTSTENSQSERVIERAGNQW